MAGLGPYWVGDTPLDAVDVVITRDGRELDLSHYSWASVDVVSPAGNPLDVSDVVVELEPTKVVVIWPTSSSIFTQAGQYALQVTLHTDTTTERAAVIPFEVRDPAPYTTAAWATPADVRSITGEVVDTDDIFRAQAIIGMLTGVGKTDVLKLSARDQYSLMLAASFQAAWMKEQPDLYSRHDVERIGADGNPVTTRDGLTFVLAPLARQAMQMCSWNSGGIRVKEIRSRFEELDLRALDERLWKKI